jgi:divalent metal cation (Fe/Co/Zn/Cd) transporter
VSLILHLTRRRRRFLGGGSGAQPRHVRIVPTDYGLVVFLTVATPSTATLTHAHALASRLEDDIRRAEASIADVVVHSEPERPQAR